MALKQLVTILFIAIFSLIVTTACSTVSGVGKDLQKVGQVIEREADKNEKKR